MFCKSLNVLSILTAMKTCRCTAPRIFLCSTAERSRFVMTSSPLSCYDRRQSRQTFEPSWSELPGAIIDRIVSVLQRSQQWKQDAPSLRTLNWHWRYQLDFHILSIQPKKTRMLATEDTVSLTNFHLLTTLDATHFVGDLSAERVLTFLEALRRLPGLTKLRLPVEALDVISPDELVQMSGLQTLVLDSQRTFLHESVRKLVQSPLTELVIWKKLSQRSNTVQQQSHFSAGKGKTNVYTTVDVFNNTRRSDSTESVNFTLNVVESSSDEFPSRYSLQSLNSLQIHADCWHRDFAPLSSLSSLKKLTMQIRASDLSSLSSLPMNIETLHLKAIRDGNFTLDFLSRMSSNLRSLTLEDFDVRGCPVLQSLTNLTSLSLISCWVDFELSSLKSLKKLRKLCWVYGFCSDARQSDADFVFDNRSFPDLRTLTFGGTGQNDALFSALTGLQKLEVLGISDHGAISSNRLKSLTLLTNLRGLGLYGKIVLPTLCQLEDEPFLSTLDTLWLGDYHPALNNLIPTPLSPSSHLDHAIGCSEWQASDHNVHVKKDNDSMTGFLKEFHSIFDWQ